MKVIATNLPPPIITIPITLIHMATITIPIVKDTWNGMHLRALSTGGQAGILEDPVSAAAAAAMAEAASTEFRRLSGPRCLHPFFKRIKSLPNIKNTGC
jgi:hypothetical protein